MIELLASVAILAVLSAIAVPGFVRYIRRSKTAEPATALEKIAGGARLYYQTEHVSPGTTVPAPRQFPDSTNATPDIECCSQPGTRCANTNWTTRDWQTLSFALEGTHYYQYQFASEGTGAASIFTTEAVGDLDCDGEHATFRRMGHAVDNEGHVDVSNPAILDPMGNASAAFEIE